MPDRRSFLTSSVLSAAAFSPLSAVSALKDSGERLKVGQIGTKHAHAAGKMATFRKYPEIFDVVGYVEPDADRRAQIANDATWKGLPVLTTEQLLETRGLHIVAVETEINELLPAAEKCVDAGIHIHLDKPAGTSLPRFRKICHAADQAGVVIQLGYMFRSNPAFRYLFNAVESGWLGDIFQVHCEMSKKIGTGARAGLAKYRGGSMFELGCHLIDAVVRVLGKPESVSPFLKQTQPELDALNDNCLAVFEYARATASIRSTLVEPFGGRRRQFVACGTNGTIVIRPLEPFHLTISLERPAGNLAKGTHEIKLPAVGGRYDGDLLHLAAVVLGQEKEEYSRTHDLAVQEAVLKASAMPVDAA